MNEQVLALSSQWRRYVMAFACLALLFFMPSHESIWIDEAYTWQIASKSTLGEWAKSMNIEALKPAALFFAWLLEKALGSSEYQLRFQNVFWGVLALWGAYKIGRRLGLPWLTAILLFHPFFWSYMNEARPYVMQIAGGCWLIYYFIELYQEKARRLFPFFAVAWLLMSTTLLAVFPATVVVAVVLWMLWRKGRLADHVRAIVGFAVGLVFLGVYYLQALIQGNGSGAKLWKQSVVDYLFSFYEFGGFMGLGPGRSEIRSAGRDGISRLFEILLPHIPLLALWGVILVAMILLCVWKFKGSKIVLWIAGITVASVCLLALAAKVVNFPFWGRHLAPIFICWVIILAYVMGSLFGRKGLYRLLVMIALALLMVSSLVQRFHPRHVHEDYRQAASLAISYLGNGKTVLWAANDACWEYYGASAAAKIGKDVLYFPVPDDQVLDYIILSRPEVFDPEGKIRRLIVESNYLKIGSLQGFEIFLKQ